MNRFLLFLLSLSMLMQPMFAQTPAPVPVDWTNQYWKARWILHPTAPARQYGIFHFRKAFDLPQKPGRFVVHVSADNRYRLFINGRAVALGPARSDTQNWNYESIDLAPYLQAGRNVLAAQVWNMGEGIPFAQMTYQTGFVVQGDGEVEKIVNTDGSWKVYQNLAYSPIKNDIPKLRTYIVAGDGDRVDAARYPWGWEQASFDDKEWSNARLFGFPTKPRGLGTDGNWGLVPRTIPMMEEGTLRLATVRRVENGTMNAAFLKGQAPVTVPANTKAVFLLDQGHLTNAYPELTVSKGKGAVVTLAYAEALFDAAGKKGNRNEVEGRTMRGFEDQLVADGSDRRTFRPLWFRTYRYLQLTVETQAEPLVLEDLIGQYTGYPFAEKAKFASTDSTAGVSRPGMDRPGAESPGAESPGMDMLKSLWNVGWRTARLCAGETYYDCPYYEQLQYTGDTRIQALISLYVAGDDRLMRKAILDYDHSRFNDGLTQSRYPSADFQVIPTFSLFWVCMIHDYWMHRQDDAFVKARIPAMLGVLNWHEQRLANNSLNGPLEWWNFVDWSAWKNAKDEIAGGVPAGARTGGSSILSLQQAYTYQRAADLLAHYGQNERAEHYRELARRINKAVVALCYDAGRGLFADQPDKKSFSQHANVLAVLTNAIPVNQQAALLQKTMTVSPDSLTQATFYFKFYLFEALKKTGLGDQFIAQLKPWQDMLALGLTTFAENPEPTRSDCHAWSASPLYELLSITCGIRPAEPGFRTVRIEPYLGPLATVSGSVPHPSGDITVEFRKNPAGGLTGNVTLPASLTGTLRWKNKTLPLKGGQQTVNL